MAVREIHIFRVRVRLALDPQRRAEVERLQPGRDAVLRLEPGLHHVELELPHRGQDQLAADRARVDEGTDRALLDELPEPAVELLAPAGVRALEPGEALGGEFGQGLVADRRAGIERVAEAEVAAAGQADDVARVGLVGGLAALGEEPVRAGQAELAPLRALVTFMSRSKRPEQTRRKATRSRWRGSMFAWILKTKPANSARSGGTGPCSPWRGPGGGAELEEGVEEGLHAEVRQGAAEEDGGDLARAGTARGRTARRRCRAAPCPLAGRSAPPRRGACRRGRRGGRPSWGRPASRACPGRRGAPARVRRS